MLRAFDRRIVRNEAAPVAVWTWLKLWHGKIDPRCEAQERLNVWRSSGILDPAKSRPRDTELVAKLAQRQTCAEAPDLNAPPEVLEVK